MTNIIEFEIRLPADADVEIIEAIIGAELKKLSEPHQVKIQRTRALGMTGAEIAISFVVSFAASVIANRYKGEIDAILDKTAGTTKTFFKILFKDED